MTSTPLPTVCLTLLVPQHAEERLIDFLLAYTGQGLDDDIEFSMHPVVARGPLVQMAAGEEQVRGYARRIEAKLLLPADVLRRLLPSIQDLLAGTDGGYWVTQVMSFGQFGPGVTLPARHRDSVQPDFDALTQPGEFESGEALFPYPQPATSRP